MIRRLARWLLRLTASAVAATVLSVLAVRSVDPPLTWTMVGAVLAHHDATGEWRWVRHEPRPLETLGAAVPRAVVMAEDSHFWHHHGFDWAAIRDALEDRSEGGRLRGGSTLSQQVARNVCLWQTRSWLRKGLESWFTVWLELLVPKERILELYVNVAETGPLVFGFEAGAQHWYGVPASRLSREQAARLAAILPAPTRRDPREQGRRASLILSRPVPFPGEPGFDRAAADASSHVGWRALFRD